MCGLAGWVLPTREAPNSGVLQDMISVISHRGPDDKGYFEETIACGEYHVALGHCRLAILDIAGGRQPMRNSATGITLAYNGELYNFQALRADLRALGHVFRTDSDTEVVLRSYEEWGPDCVERFRGMFAFALWDAPQNRLVLARDPFGKKPMFFAELKDGILFASEIKALLSFPTCGFKVDHESVWEYLAYRYVPGPATLFSGVCKVPPGSLLVWENGCLRSKRYFDPPDRLPWRGEENHVDPVSLFLKRFDEAVRLRMVSDVPYGAFVSGGIDSAAVVAMMSRYSTSPVQTFSVGFQEDQYNELEFARLVAVRFRTDHHELIIDPRHVMERLPTLIRFRDAPVSEPSDVPLYELAKEARNSVKMVLTGEGSDELLGGYPKHVYERYAWCYQKIPGFIRRNVIAPLVHQLPYRFRRVKTAVVNFGLTKPEDRLPRWFGALSPAEREWLVSPDLKSVSGTDRRGNGFDMPEGNSPLRRILYFDQTSWLPDNLLERGDRVTMAASLEARMPFLDTKLADFVSSLPDRFRVSGWQTKCILRSAMNGILPMEILRRPKLGFRVPVERWFRGQLREFLYDHLAGPDALTAPYYRPKALATLLDEHTRGKQNHEKILWTLLNLELWHRQFLGSRKKTGSLPGQMSTPT